MGGGGELWAHFARRATACDRTVVGIQRSAMTTATPFQIGNVVPNYVGLPVTITGIGDGYYESAYGGAWVAQSADDGTVYLLSLIHISEPTRPY